MAQRLQVLKCDKCGNIVMVFHAGTGNLWCCKEPMKVLTENTTDAAVEKHVPVIERTAEGVKVKVGGIPHPMESAHYIEWVELLTDNRMYCQFLEPGSPPEAVFPAAADSAALTAREYCNMHGYWKG